MTSSSLSSAPAEATLIEDWPMSLAATREQLRKAEVHLERYRAALRLAGVEIERRNRGLMALTTFGYQASRVAQPIALLKLALVQALETTGVPIGAVILIDTETKALTLSVHQGLTPGLSRILTGQQWDQGAMALMPHLVAGDGALLEYETSQDEAERMLLAVSCLTSLASLPLRVGSRLLGALLVGLPDQRRFTPTDLCFLMALSQEIAANLDSLRLREGLWQTAETLLGNAAPELDQPQADQLEFILDQEAVSFELSSLPLTLPQPAQDDLEQLLAAVMEAEDEVQQQNADLQRLNTIAEMMNRSLNLKEILQCAVDQTQAILQTGAAWLYLIDNQKQQLELRAHTGLSAAYVRGMQSLNLNAALEGRAAVQNKACFVDAVSQDIHAYKIWIDKEKLEALAAVPLTRPGAETGEPTDQNGSHVIGVLATGRRADQAAPWSPREIRLLTSIANQVALAIDNARLYARVQEEEAKLRLGNQVLSELNDMLLKKNTYLEGFIQEDLDSALTLAGLSLSRLTARETASLSEKQKQDIDTLQTIVKRLSERAKMCLSL
jgi:GAF domain-containing protein